MKYIPFFIALLCLNLPTKAQTVDIDTAFMQPYYAFNHHTIDGYFDKGKMPTRTTANKRTIVYMLPNLQAKQIDTLGVFTSISYLQEGTNAKTNENWVKINYKTRDKQGVYQNNEGYVLDQNISLGTVAGNSETENLDFVLTESPLLDEDLKMPRFRLNAVSRFTDLNFNKVKNVSTYDLDIGAVNLYNHFYLSSVTNNAFKNGLNLLRLYWHQGESCPESEGNVFVAYVNGKMTEIISSMVTGEGVFYETTKVYLPLKLAKEKVLLVENGDSQNMLDHYTGILKTIPYPKDCGVPVEQLVVQIEEDAEAKTDANGSYVLNKDKENIMEITHKVVKYYRWDGAKLHLAKKIVVKQHKQN